MRDEINFKNDLSSVNIPERHSNGCESKSFEERDDDENKLVDNVIADGDVNLKSCTS